MEEDSYGPISRIPIMICHHMRCGCGLALNRLVEILKVSNLVPRAKAVAICDEKVLHRDGIQ